MLGPARRRTSEEAPIQAGVPLRSRAMKNGLGQAVLVTELLVDDGPFWEVANDFLSGNCSRCGERESEEPRFSVDGRFLCRQCLSMAYAA